MISIPISLRRAGGAALLLSSMAAAAAPPQRVTLEYQMSRNGAVMVEVKETLEHDRSSYRIVSEGRGVGVFALSGRGSVSRSSRGTIGRDGLRPSDFRDQRGDDVATAKFDWAAKALTEERRGKGETRPLAAGTQDRLSFLWNAAFAPPKGGRIDAIVADGRGTTEFHYTVAGSESLKTPAGEIEALHLVKRKDPGDERATEIWLAARRHFLPVRILVIEKDGTRIDQVVTRIGD